MAIEPRKKALRQFNHSGLSSPPGIDRALRRLAIEIDENEDDIKDLQDEIAGLKKDIAALKPKTDVKSVGKTGKGGKKP